MKKTSCCSLIVISFFLNNQSSAATSYHIPNGGSAIINEFSNCRQVTNNSGHNLFVATNSSLGWASFYNNSHPGVTVAACPPPIEYIGVLNSRTYYTTPGGCNNSTTPTCPGTTDNLALAWATASPEKSTNLHVSDWTYGKVNSATLAGYATANAAKFCENMVYGGYSDWYLPSYNELVFLYNNQTNVTGLANYVYWTTNDDQSDRPSTVAVSIHFEIDLNVYTTTKTGMVYVRCVRSQ